ncbi:MAG: hypothetical protein H6672_19925 [Anaerolineaceae bacterium]|nr:hypothetical protein [Anaerolineaceae bacterium]
MVAVLIALLSVGFFTVSAQDSSNNAMMDTIVCDADLILNLYVAENYFGFDAVVNTMVTDGNSGMMGIGLDAYDKGQYAELFAAMMTAREDTMAAGGMLMSQDELAMVTEYMMMGMAGLTDMMRDHDTPMDGVTALVPPTLADEAPECTALRTELDLFYAALGYYNMMMMTSES